MLKGRVKGSEPLDLLQRQWGAKEKHVSACVRATVIGNKQSPRMAGCPCSTAPSVCRARLVRVLTAFRLN